MFAGVFTYSDAAPPAAWAEKDDWRRALYPHHTPDVTGDWSNDHALVVESDVVNTPWSHHTKAVPFVDGGHVVAFWGRLDNREELAAQLDVRAKLSTVPDPVLVHAAWRRWGERLPEKLLGDFALAVIDTQDRRLFLARDPVGIKPLYYWPHADGFVFASTAAAFRCLKARSPTPDMDWAARYILNLSQSHDRTAYREIMKLPGGHCATVSATGDIRLRRYHEWRDDAPEIYRRDPKWVEDYRAVLDEAIRCRMPSNYPLGTENSGGIDSATITAYLAKFLGEPGDRLHSLGFAFSEQEPAFILETSRKWRIKHNYIVTSHDVSYRTMRDWIQQDLEVLGYPEEHGNGSGHRPFYEACRLHDIRTLYSGFGGDEVVTNYAYNVRLELLDRQRYGAFTEMMRGRRLFRPLRAIKRIPIDRRPLQYNARFLPAWNARWPHQPLRESVVDRLDLHHAYMETARYDAPYRRNNDWIINGLLTMPYIPTRLESCSLIAASWGIDYRWPLWDVRLVQQYLSTPAIERFGPGGVNRYLHRRAISDTVPDLVAWKRTKDMGNSIALPQADRHARALLIEQMKQSAATLHPALVELIDGDKWRGLIRCLEGNEGDAERAFMACRSSNAVLRLNHWLHDGRV